MTKNLGRATVRVLDYDVEGLPRPDDLAILSAPLTSILTAELEEAYRYLRVTVDELILAALARTIARTIGTGDVTVDVFGEDDAAVTLAATTVRQVSATRALRITHRALAAAHRGIERDAPSSDVAISYLLAAHEPVRRQILPSRGHAVELRVYRSGGLLQLDWWYDTRKLEPGTIEEIAEQFPLALIELTSEAAPLVHDAAEMVMVS